VGIIIASPDICHQEVPLIRRYGGPHPHPDANIYPLWSTTTNPVNIYTFLSEQIGTNHQPNEEVAHPQVCTVSTLQYGYGPFFRTNMGMDCGVEKCGLHRIEWLGIKKIFVVIKV
jgi:hypothetical protein